MHTICKVFIETGTNCGATALWAAQYFQKLYNREQLKKYMSGVVNNYGHLKNVDFLLGNSKEQLAAIVPYTQSNLVFFARRSRERGMGQWRISGVSAAGELQIINDSECEHFILIDDARLFLCPPPNPHR
jgi:hypothetical protein